MPLVLQERISIQETTREAVIRPAKEVALDLATIVVAAEDPIGAFAQAFWSWGIQATATGVSVELLCEELVEEIEAEAKARNYQETPLGVVLPVIDRLINHHFGDIVVTLVDQEEYLLCSECEVETLKLSDPLDESMDHLGTCMLCGLTAGVILS